MNLSGPQCLDIRLGLYAFLDFNLDQRRDWCDVFALLIVNSSIGQFDDHIDKYRA